VHLRGVTPVSIVEAARSTHLAATSSVLPREKYMKKVLLGAVVAALCGVPVTSRAEAAGAPRRVTAQAPREAQAGAASGDAQKSEGEASDYAEREKAAPQLAEFSGGDQGIYIGTGALLAAILVVLLITAL
jgi:hypothetical protein